MGRDLGGLPAARPRLTAMPAVSVIVPCYNAVEHLPRALDSVRAQTFGDVEIIVVDDGSTDAATIAYLAGLGSDVTVIHQANKGLPAARNAGFSRARGDLVVPLDCDDWIEPAFIAKLHDALAGSPGGGFAFSHLALEGEASGVLRKNFNVFEQLFVNQLPYCMLIPRRVWRDAGGYDESMRHGYEDWEFNIRIAALGVRGVVVPEPLFHYTVSGTGMLQSVSSARHGQLWRDIQRRNALSYRPAALLRSWRAWRRSPSTYPLALYFIWFALHRILPARWFAALFGLVLSVSHSRRATLAAR